MIRQLRSAIARLGRIQRHTASPDEIRRVFAGYKKVLEDNGRALAVLTDMGEKMGGDYLFDVIYVQRSWEQLSTSMRQSLRDFAALTNGRYAVLDDRFESIDSHISAAMWGRSPAARRLVADFDEIKWEMAREVGGKSFHLAEMRRGMPQLRVPAGFAITVAAFEEFVRHNRLDARLAAVDSTPAGAVAAAELRAAIRDGEVPQRVRVAVAGALERLRRETGNDVLLAVRSSAEEEDSDVSFAGQFETVLGVPASADQVVAAWRRVVASAFSDEAIAYYHAAGNALGAARMAAAVVPMTDAAAAGVIYTRDPSGQRPDSMVVSSSWGLGSGVVSGSVEADFFTVSRHAPHDVLASRAGSKKTTYKTNGQKGNVSGIATPADRAAALSLTPAQLAELASQALLIEEFFHQPQDIEWALDAGGRFIMLQARPLAGALPEEATGRRDRHPAMLPPALMEHRGQVVQRGAVTGKVFIAENLAQLEYFPRGAILVAQHDAPQLASVMPYAGAIITDTGNVASHMASLSREFRVPTVVNMGDATSRLKPGSDITLTADEDGAIAIYAGIVPGLVDEQHAAIDRLERLYEFRRKKYIMRLIAPLHLIDPLGEGFTPEFCRTVHDLLRFMHEKSIRELAGTAERAGPASARMLELPIPDAIRVIDIGVGLSERAGDPVVMDDIKCLPLRMVMEGMSDPRVWKTDAVSVNLSDFLMGMVRAGDALSESAASSLNLAVISRNYLNLSLRFGYHFNVLDAYCSDAAANNYIYFRFTGGAADITKRERRVRLIEELLGAQGFSCRVSGDVIEARLSAIGRDQQLPRLTELGRLIAFTRQLDVALSGDDAVEQYAERFRHIV